MPTSGSTLQRTIRRGVAVLLIPLSLYPMVFMTRREAAGYSYRNIVLETADEMALAVLLGAVFYLAGSLLVQVAGIDTGPENTDTTGQVD